jgi:hypothetical protein
MPGGRGIALAKVEIATKRAVQAQVEREPYMIEREQSSRGFVRSNPKKKNRDRIVSASYTSVA